MIPGDSTHQTHFIPTAMIAGLPLPSCSPHYDLTGYRKVWELSVPTSDRELRASLGVLDFFRGYHLKNSSLMAPLVAL